MTVLIVEHEHLARRTLEEELSDMPSVERTLSTAWEQETEEILSSQAIDVLLLDMQLPDGGAFRIANRTWGPRIPVIICTVVFERQLLNALSRFRVEHLVRPFSSEELCYVLTRGQRAHPIDPVENLDRLLQVAMHLNYPVRGRIRASRHGRSVVLGASDVAAVCYGRGRFHLWTKGGVFESAQSLDEFAGAIDLSVYRRVSPDTWINKDRQRFGAAFEQAQRWLRWRRLHDMIANLRAPARIRNAAPAANPQSRRV